MELADTHETRQTVTVLFGDLVGSTSLGEGMDPEALRRLLTRYYDEMRAVVERHGGSVEKFIGDAVMAVFGSRARTRTTRCAPYAPRSRCTSAWTA